MPRNGRWSNSSNQKSHSDLVKRKSIMAPSKGNDFFKPSSWFSRTRVGGENTHCGQIWPLYRTVLWTIQIPPPFMSFILSITHTAGGDGSISIQTQSAVLHGKWEIMDAVILICCLFITTLGCKVEHYNHKRVEKYWIPPLYILSKLQK